MNKLGLLQTNDPLYGWMVSEVFPQMGFREKHPTVTVYSIPASNCVYLHKVFGQGKTLRLIGKFGTDSTSDKMFRKELENYRKLGELDLHNGLYRTMRILAHNSKINHVLVIEYVSGRSLSRIIEAAVCGNEKGLYHALSELAYFLYLLHSRSNDGSKVNFTREMSYFKATLDQLKGKTPISEGEEAYFNELAERWKNRSEMWEATSSFVHGDCTPSNFVFSKDPRVTALDLERCRRSDPAFDTGRMAGELKHSFLQLTASGERAESFITHFYKSYCSHYDTPEFFSTITKRNPFYQAVTELRIAKNLWLPLDHRHRLIYEAKKCLETG